MPTIYPYIPSTITVHMGLPSQQAENVTVSFPDYVKNVASSEVYPTWEPAALRANILAIVSFALNRVYTEFYRSRGYDFQITATTAYDQKFIRGRNIFENISQAVDELFNDYIRRKGFIEPLSANVSRIFLLQNGF
jgi:peptidoglycan hydrolase-like amidase